MSIKEGPFFANERIAHRTGTAQVVSQPSLQLSQAQVVSQPSLQLSHVPCALCLVGLKALEIYIQVAVFARRWCPSFERPSFELSSNQSVGFIQENKKLKEKESRRSLYHGGNRRNPVSFLLAMSELESNGKDGIEMKECRELIKCKQEPKPCSQLKAWMH
ncbi:hypothetical protein NPIL_256001 [Nephila pilipes]|uniref:Uncharacterized protein n=1 Tax=Nephila pilipes TaxID=299642 RepID=A0A8X6R8U4_NEPPI|nr:hypothetical protein NPIL_256001 [Nephila pilipes]